MHQLARVEIDRLKKQPLPTFTAKLDSDARERALLDAMALLVAIEDIKMAALDLTRIGHEQRNHAVSNLAGGLFVVHGRLKYRFSDLLAALQDA